MMGFVPPHVEYDEAVILDLKNCLLSIMVQHDQSPTVLRLPMRIHVENER